MASGQIVLLDLPSRPPCSTWSLNPWKTRFLLNFKGIDYKTEWVEYPDLKERLEKHVPAREELGPKYTIPTIILPDGEYVMDSRKIATIIEEKYPEPTVHLDSPSLAKLEGIMGRMMKPFAPLFLAQVPKNILNEASHEYWYATRSQWVGMHVDEFEKENGGEVAWEGLAPLLQEVTALLTENKDGPFFMGKTVSYADFVWGGFLIFARCTKQEILDETLKLTGDAQAHTALLEGLRPWSERCGH